MMICNKIHVKTFSKGWGDFIFGFNFNFHGFLYIHIAQLGVEFLWGDWLKECLDIGIVKKD